jgi:hypothetical protein
MSKEPYSTDGDFRFCSKVMPGDARYSICHFLATGGLSLTLPPVRGSLNPARSLLQLGGLAANAASSSTADG